MGTAPLDALNELSTQEPQWSPGEHGDPLEYAEIQVPRDYAEPDGVRLTLALSRLRAAHPARRRGVLLAVNGGPGGDSGRGRRLAAAFAGTPVHEVHDIIGFDPRGTGASTPLYAEVVVPQAGFDSRPPDSAFAAIAEDMRRRELGCERAGGDLRPHVSTRNTARDMDLIRAVLGEDRINVVGYAYGSYVAAVYGSLFGDRLDRSVLDSSVNPHWTWREQFLWQGDAVQRNVDQWARWTGERHWRYGLGATQKDVLATVEDAVAALDALSDAQHRTLLDGAVGTRANDRAKWGSLAELVGAVRSAAGRGDREKVRALLAEQNTWRPSDNEGDLRTGVLEAVTLEHEWPDDLDVYYQNMREFRKRFPYGYGVLRAQPWVGAFRTFQPAEPPARLARDGYPVGLVVHADGDPLDHYAGGMAMAQLLGHHLVTIEDSGEHEIYVLGGNACVDEIVNRYLVDGELPPKRVSCDGKVRRPDVPADGTP